MGEEPGGGDGERQTNSYLISLLMPPHLGLAEL